LHASLKGQLLWKGHLAVPILCVSILRMLS
jgi:hypothetical protein